MANRIVESQNMAITAPNSSVALSSGTPTVPVCSKLVAYCTVSGNITIKTIDGTSVTINAIAANTLIVLDVQFDTVTWTGTFTAAGFYTQ